MPCDAHRSWKKGNCPSCGGCRCCPPASGCDPAVGRHTCSAAVSSPAASSGKGGGSRSKPKPSSSSKKKKRKPSTPAPAPLVPAPNPGSIPPPPGPCDRQLYRVGDVVFAEDKSSMLWEAIIKNCKLQPTNKKKAPSSSPSTSAAGSPATRTHEWKYLVHYQGWNARWDRWTDGSDLRRDDPRVRAEAQRRHDEAAEREREHKARQREKREQQRSASSSSAAAARKRKKAVDGSGGDNGDFGGGGTSDDAASDGNTAASKSGKRRRMTSPAASKSRSKAAGPPSRECVQSTLEMCCALPFTLRTILVDDKANITRLGRYVASGYDDVRCVPNWKPPRMVHVLPSALPVKILLQQFWKEKKKSIKENAKSAARMAKNKEEEARSDFSDLEAGDIAGIKERQAALEIKWKNFLQGIIDLFDDALAPFLLYNQERAHYLAAKMDHAQGRVENGDGDAAPSASDIYGAELLLRLFVRLPQIVASSSCQSVEAPLFPDRASLTSFADCMSDLIVHLQKNKAACFKGRYREPKEIECTREEANFVKQCATRDASS